MYSHAKFVKNCFEKKIDVLRNLKINLLKRKINEKIKKSKKWSFVHGFSEYIQKLLEFEKKINFIYVNKNFVYIQ